MIYLASTNGTGLIMLLVLVLFIALFSFSGMKVIKEGEMYVVERLGAYHQTLEAGIHFLMPGMDRVKAKLLKSVNSHENKTTFLTKDDQKVTFHVHISYIIKDPKLFVYGVMDINRALQVQTEDILKYDILKTEALLINERTIEFKDTLFESISERIAAFGLKCTSVSLDKEVT